MYNNPDSQDWTAHNNCDHIPNAKTVAAMEEAEQLLQGIKSGKKPRYVFLEEFIEEIES